MRFKIELNQKQYQTLVNTLKEEPINGVHKLIFNRDIDEALMIVLTFC